TVHWTLPSVMSGTCRHGGCCAKVQSLSAATTDPSPKASVQSGRLLLSHPRATDRRPTDTDILEGRESPGRSVVVPAWPVHMLVRQLFFAGRPHSHDLDVEKEILARKGMIAIHRDGVGADLPDHHFCMATALRPRRQRHAFAQFGNAAEGFARHALHPRGVVFAITICG